MEHTRVSFISKEKQKPCGSGRRKIQIRRIENTFHRNVAFSNQKCLFSKVGELFPLFDSNIGIIVFSAAGKMFSFGHPSADHEEDNDNNINNPCKQETTNEESPKLAGEEGFWWKESVESLSMDEVLEKYKDSLQLLRNNVASKLEDLMMRRKFETCLQVI